MDFLNWGHEEVAPLLVKSEEWYLGRNDSLGGSDANIIMSGDEQALINLWRSKRGELEREDLSGVLPIQMGSWTEAFNRFWYTQQTGLKIHSVGVKLTHKSYDFLHHSLDGIVGANGTSKLFEAKHTNAFSNMDDTVTKYYPQMQHGMLLGELQECDLSVFFGNMKWEVRTIAADPFYQAELLERETAFWLCVKQGIPPATLPQLMPPAGVIEYRAPVDMTGSNEWASHACDWLENKEASMKFWKASDNIKAMVPQDVLIAKGHGVQAKRDKNGSIRITKGK
jgi:hypothetical protein